MRFTPTWKNTGRYVTAFVVCAILGWFAFVQHTRVPLLGAADLGFHELGHLITYIIPVPDLVTAMAGSVTQVAIPLGLFTYFIWFRRDEASAAVLLAWAATSAQDASVYIADAPFERLLLIGGQHDWAWALGPRGFDVLDSAGTIAGAVEWFGFVLLLGGIGLCVAGPIQSYRAERSTTDARRRRTPLPVRAARPPRG
jgi:hypothetical protein